MPGAESKSQALVARLVRPEVMAWRGQRPLAATFWGHGVLVSLVLMVLHATALGQGQLLVEQRLIVVSALYTPWIVVSIWRCAERASLFWGTLARWLTVAWALNCALVLPFLQAELGIRYARG